MKTYTVVIKAENMEAIDEALETGLADFSIETYVVVTEDGLPVEHVGGDQQWDLEVMASRNMILSSINTK